MSLADPGLEPLESDPALVKLLIPLGARTGRVEAFLLSTLREKSLALYSRALAAFRDEIVGCRGVAWADLSERGRDELLAEYILDGLEVGKGRQSFCVLLAALHKITPHHRYRTSSAVLSCL